MLEILSVEFRYSSQSERGVGPVSFCLPEGECVGLMGPSGSGKTTLLKVIAGLLPSGAEQSLKGSISSNPKAIDDVRIGFMFQQATLLPQKDVLGNVLLPLVCEAYREDDRSRAIALLARLGLGDCERLRPEELSGGMRTRVALARALINTPRLLLLDEPFAGLDVAVREKAYQVIDELEERSKGSTILVTHDVEEAWRMCHRVLVLSSEGTIRTEIKVPRGADFSQFRNQAITALDGDA